jgi:hypothetical protein
MFKLQDALDPSRHFVTGRAGRFVQVDDAELHELLWLSFFGSATEA